MEASLIRHRRIIVFVSSSFCSCLLTYLLRRMTGGDAVTFSCILLSEEEEAFVKIIKIFTLQSPKTMRHAFNVELIDTLYQIPF